MIDGINLTENKIIHHPDGDILHIIQNHLLDFVGLEKFTLHPFIRTKSRLKRHNYITINLTVIQGSIKFSIYDDRANSNTTKR